VGSQVKVNALAVLLAILLGGWLWGISGMILFIPLAGGLKDQLKKVLWYVGLRLFTWR
jgi:predicted PurR-regulated permease PerM